MSGKLEKLFRILCDSRLARGLPYGIAAAIESQAILPRIPLAFIADVGANKGQFSLVARALYPNAHIHAFEPLPQAADRFQSLFRKDSQVTLHQTALGEQAGQFDFHVSAKPDSSSLLPITQRQLDFAPNTTTVTTITVPVIRLDHQLDPRKIQGPALLKLDVQGAELSVLKGADGCVNLFDYILCEVSFERLYQDQPLAHEIVDFLRLKNFVLQSVGYVWKDRQGTPIQADFLFISKTKSTSHQVSPNPVQS
jgi:FkbM family methyltransferase